MSGRYVDRTTCSDTIRQQTSDNLIQYNAHFFVYLKVYFHKQSTQNGALQKKKFDIFQKHFFSKPPYESCIRQFLGLPSGNFLKTLLLRFGGIFI
jgi:hypothetical protein